MEEAGQGTPQPLTVRGCPWRNPKSENRGRADRLRVEQTSPGLSKQDMDTPTPRLGKVEANGSEHKICKTAMPKPAWGPHGWCQHSSHNREEELSRFPATRRKALKSSKVRLVTLQIQNDLLTCSKYTRSEFKNKLNSLYSLGTIAIQF